MKSDSLHITHTKSGLSLLLTVCLVIFIILNMTRKSSSWNFRQLRNMYKKKFYHSFLDFQVNAPKSSVTKLLISSYN